MQYNQAQISHLSDLAVEKIEEIFQLFGITGLKYTSKKIWGSCPVHEGDKNNAFNAYIGGHTTNFHWKCRSRACHETFKTSVIGLIRGLLSKDKYGWQGATDKTVSFAETVNWLAARLRTNLKDIKVEDSDLEKMAFARHVNLLNPVAVGQKKNISLTREDVRGRLKMPCDYFLERGFSEAILNKYDIGTCTTSDYRKPMYGRAVVPIYDNEHKYLVGCTGRSLAKKECDKCKGWHIGNCPKPEFQWQFSKWRHEGFPAEKTLFNMWYARRHIQERGTAILVESPGNILKLETLGVPIGLATFGAHITPSQELLLTSSGALNLIVIGDKDQAGEEYIKVVKERCSRNFNVYSLLPDHGDLAELPEEAARLLIFPLLNKLKAE